MTVIAVCALGLVPETAARLRPWGVITLIDPTTPVDTPAGLEAGRHLRVGVNDVTAHGAGLIVPAVEHVEQVLTHARAWDVAHPLLIHCWAGVSRSTASAFMTACLVNPHVAEAEIAAEIRRRSPTATPNRLLVSIADDLLGRGGRMVDAVDSIGRGADCWEGVPFELPATWGAPA